MPTKKPVSRRKFLAASAAGATAISAAGVPALAGSDSPTSRQATGVKVGEVTDTSAIVWMRLTANAGPNAKGRTFRPASRSAAEATCASTSCAAPVPAPRAACGCATAPAPTWRREEHGLGRRRGRRPTSRTSFA